MKVYNKYASPKPLSLAPIWTSTSPSACTGAAQRKLVLLKTVAGTSTSLNLHTSTGSSVVKPSPATNIGVPPETGPADGTMLLIVHAS